MNSIRAALCGLASLAVVSAQEPDKARSPQPMRAVAAPMAAKPAAQGAALAREFGFMPGLLRYHSGDALPDFELLGADGNAVGFAAARGKAPTIVVMAPSIATDERTTALKEGAKAIDARYASYGVKTMVWGLWMPRAEFLASASEQAGSWPFALFGEPVAPFAGDVADQEARLAHHATTVLGRLFAGGMTTPLPACFVVGADGKLAGSFALRGAEPPFDGIGNLLLRAGVELRDADRPSKVAPEAAFAKPAPRPVETPVEMVKPGAKAADFAMVGVDGKPVRLADYVGKVVVLDFWATWCGPCLAALPHVDEVAAKYKAQGVVVIASCTGDDQEAFDRWIGENAAKYPNVVFGFDPLAKSPERASRKLYGVGGIPQQFVVGRDGTIAAAVTGYMKGEVLLDAALAAAGIEVPAEVLEQARKDQQKREEMARGRK